MGKSTISMAMFNSYVRSRPPRCSPGHAIGLSTSIHTNILFCGVNQGLPTPLQNGDLTGEISGYDYRYHGIVLEYD